MLLLQMNLGPLYFHVFIVYVFTSFVVSIGTFKSVSFTNYYLLKCMMMWYSWRVCNDRGASLGLWKDEHIVVLSSFINFFIKLDFHLMIYLFFPVTLESELTISKRPCRMYVWYVVKKKKTLSYARHVFYPVRARQCIGNGMANLEYKISCDSLASCYCKTPSHCLIMLRYTRYHVMV